MGSPASENPTGAQGRVQARPRVAGVTTSAIHGGRSPSAARHLRSSRRQRNAARQHQRVEPLEERRNAGEERPSPPAPRRRRARRPRRRAGSARASDARSRRSGARASSSRTPRAAQREELVAADLERHVVERPEGTGAAPECLLHLLRLDAAVGSWDSGGHARAPRGLAEAGLKYSHAPPPRNGLGAPGTLGGAERESAAFRGPRSGHRGAGAITPPTILTPDPSP